MESFPKTMRAVFAGDEVDKLVVKEVKTPVPGIGEVLVRINAAPVNPSDLAGIRKAREKGESGNYIPGLEGSGTVVASGKGLLPKLWLGKRVACSSTHHTSGTWAEYVVTRAAMCFPLNKAVSDEQGSMMLVNPLTALAFIDIAKKNNHKAIINNAAASSLGRMVEFLAAKSGIPVINLVRKKEQVETLSKAGSPYVLNTSEDSFIKNFSSLSSKLDATLLFDSVCSPVTGKMINALPEGSSVIIYGNLTGEEFFPVNPRSLIDKDIEIHGFFLGSYAGNNSMFRNMLNLLKVGTLLKDDIRIKINNTYPLEKAQEAVDTYLNNMTEGKILLVP